MTSKGIPKLRKAPKPPLSHPGAIPDSGRAKKPALSEPTATDQELNPGDRVEGLGNFGKPTGELGTVEQTNEEDALVKWDDDGRKRLRQPSLKKVAEERAARSEIDEEDSEPSSQMSVGETELGAKFEVKSG
jgi:hypothetical protein